MLAAVVWAAGLVDGKRVVAAAVEAPAIVVPAIVVPATVLPAIVVTGPDEVAVPAGGVAVVASKTGDTDRSKPTSNSCQSPIKSLKAVGPIVIFAKPQTAFDPACSALCLLCVSCS